MPDIDISAIQSDVQQHSDDIITFLREICAIPSMDSQIGPVGERVQAEMRGLGFDTVWFDSMGNTVGKIGNGDRVIVYDIPNIGFAPGDEVTAHTVLDSVPLADVVKSTEFYALPLALIK